jgi:hypothetical protein
VHKAGDSVSQRIRRRRPRCLTGNDGAASELSRTTGTSEYRAKKSIEEALLAGYTCERNPATGFPAFAFRLHQFISRGDTIYASLESEEQRYLTLNRQQFVPGDRKKVFLPLVFCRECGQENSFRSLVRRQPLLDLERTTSSKSRWLRLPVFYSEPR